MEQANGGVEVRRILDWWRRRHPEHQRSACICTIGGVCASAEALAKAVGVSHSTMHRRLRAGVLTLDEADDWACAVGVLPSTIWPDYNRLVEVDRVEACPRVALGDRTVAATTATLTALLTGTAPPLLAGAALFPEPPRRRPLLTGVSLFGEAVTT